MTLLFIFYRLFNEDFQPIFATSFLITEFELIEMGLNIYLTNSFWCFFIGVFFWVDQGQPGSTHLTRDPITWPGRWLGRVSKLWSQQTRHSKLHTTCKKVWIWLMKHLSFTVSAYSFLYVNCSPNISSNIRFREGVNLEISCFIVKEHYCKVF